MSLQRKQELFQFFKSLNEKMEEAQEEEERDGIKAARTSSAATNFRSLEERCWDRE